VGNRAGSRHHAAKVTEEDVRAMRAARDRGETIERVYALFGHLGLSHSSVEKICRRESWKHVP
jgi:hypothetical protein